MKTTKRHALPGPFLLMLACVLPGCNLLSPPTAQPSLSAQTSDSTLARTDWVLHGEEWEVSGPYGGNEIYISFESVPTTFPMDMPDGLQVNFYLFCNSGGGAYKTLGEGRIEIVLSGARQQGCGDRKDATVTAFLAVLRTVNRYGVEGDVLTLYDEEDPDGALVFHREAEGPFYREPGDSD